MRSGNLDYREVFCFVLILKKDFSKDPFPSRQRPFLSRPSEKVESGVSIKGRDLPGWIKRETEPGQTGEGGKKRAHGGLPRLTSRPFYWLMILLRKERGGLLRVRHTRTQYV